MLQAEEHPAGPAEAEQSPGPPSAARAPLTHRVILPPSPWTLLDFGEVWRARDVLWRLSRKEVTLRYRQTMLGVAWVILQPLLGSLIFAVVFGRVAHLPSQGRSYVVFAFAGLVGWTAFSTTFARAGTSLVANAALISKVFFPRILLPLSVIWAVMIDLVVSLGMMGVLMVIFHVSARPSLLLLPVWILLIMIAAIGCGLISGSIMVRYRDMAYVVPVALQLLLFASPVAYSLAAVPPSTRLFFTINPLSAILEGFRWSLLGERHISDGELLYSVAAVLVILVLGILSFSRLERGFADVI